MPLRPAIEVPSLHAARKGKLHDIEMQLTIIRQHVDNSLNRRDHCMALGGIDVNLLVILQALIEEGSVTRAGMRVGMPQPAMSTALARLRRHYKDELLVRTGNGYELTPLARS